MAEPSQLPPLILHPFGGASATSELLEGSSAALALQSFSTSSDDQSELFRRIIQGRYQEIRMLLFLGKDIFRWMQQCVECLARSGGSVETDRRLSEQSFAAFLVEEPPAGVQAKLEKWGVSDRRAVFSRAVGINSLFQSPPPLDSLAPGFLKNYHRYADHAYICFQHLQPFHALDAKRFDFEIYGSEEYAKILSDQWEHA